MQQIMERRKVVDKYRSMMVERMDLIPLESNSYKSDPVVISHTIQMIEVIFFGILRPFRQSYPTSREDRTKNSMKIKISPCTVQKKTKLIESWMRKKLLTSVVKVGLQPVKSTMEKKAGNEKFMTQRRAKQSLLESKNRPEKDHQVDETEEIKVVMMCWENSAGSLGKEPYKETDDQEESADKEMQKLKDEEEHVNSTLHTGN